MANSDLKAAKSPKADAVAHHCSDAAEHRDYACLMLRLAYRRSMRTALGTGGYGTTTHLPRNILPDVETIEDTANRGVWQISHGYATHSG